MHNRMVEVAEKASQELAAPWAVKCLCSDDFLPEVGICCLTGQYRNLPAFTDQPANCVPAMRYSRALLTCTIVCLQACQAPRLWCNSVSTASEDRSDVLEVGSSLPQLLAGLKGLQIARIGMQGFAPNCFHGNIGQLAELLYLRLDGQASSFPDHECAEYAAKSMPVASTPRLVVMEMYR